MTNEIESVLFQMAFYEDNSHMRIKPEIIRRWINTLQRLQQQTPATSEAGCEDEVNRSVSWTVQRTGFAELRARCEKKMKHAEREAAYAAKVNQIGSYIGAMERVKAFSEMIEDIDELEADAKSAST